MSEIWKDIPGYEGHYQASNFGKIRSIKSDIKILKGDYQNNGYKRVYLWKDGKKKNKLVHRLIALTFIPKKSNLDEVNHIDENKDNNHVNNLQWCNHIYNMNYGSVGKKIRKANKGREITDETRTKLADNSRNRRWMTKGNVDRLIKPTSISFFIDQGWIFGRKEYVV